MLDRQGRPWIEVIEFLSQLGLGHVRLRQREADQVGLDRLGAFQILVGEHRDDHFRRAHVEQALLHVGEGLAFVEDVVDHDDDAARHVLARDDLPHDLAAAVGVAVAAHVDVVEFEREVELRQQVAGEHDGAAHHAQHQREGLLVGIAEARVQLGGNARHGGLDFLGRDDLGGVGEQCAGAVMVVVLHGRSVSVIGMAQR